jgi:peptidyl-prolyl cis-trans isomerase SurA
MIAASSNPLPFGASGVRFAEAAGRRSRVVALALAAMLAGAGSAGAATEPASTEPLRNSRFDNGVVAVVDGEPITLRELKKYGESSAPFLPPEVRADYRELLDSLIEHKLLKSEFEKNGVAASDEMVERYISGVLQEGGQTRASLEADIARAGLTWKDYFERMREEVQRIQLVNLLIRSRVNVPEEEVRRAWESDPKYLESEKLVVAAIFLPAGTTGDESDAAAYARKVQAEAKSDFADAAKKYSKGPAASEGGVLGEFKRGTMAAHFEKALDGLGEGKVSEPVMGQGGYYIVKLVDVKSSGRREFDDVKKEIGEQIYEQRLTDRYRKWVTEDLRKDHRVDNLVDSLALIAAGGSPAPAPAAQPKPAAAAAPEPAAAQKD